MKWGVASVAIGVLISVFFNGTPASASVDDFYFSDFTVDYHLSKDDEGRSILKVDESLTAEFPPYQQNKGIVRAIPLSYDGHPVSLEFDDTSLMRDVIKDFGGGGSSGGGGGGR